MPTYATIDGATAANSFACNQLAHSLNISANERNDLLGICSLIKTNSVNGIAQITVESDALNQYLSQISHTYLSTVSFEWRFLIALFLNGQSETAYKIAYQLPNAILPQDLNAKKAILQAWEIATLYADKHHAPYIKPNTVSSALALQTAQKICSNPHDILVMLLFPSYYRDDIKLCNDCSIPDSFVSDSWDFWLFKSSNTNAGAVLKTKYPMPVATTSVNTMLEYLVANSPLTYKALKLYVQSSDHSLITQFWALLHAIGGITKDELKADILGILYSIPTVSRQVLIKQTARLITNLGGIQNDVNKKFIIIYLKDLICTNRTETCSVDFVELSGALVSGLNVTNETCKTDLVGVLRNVPCVDGNPFVNENNALVNENAIQIDENKIKLSNYTASVNSRSTEIDFIKKVKLFRACLKNIIKFSGIVDENSKIIIASALTNVIKAASPNTIEVEMQKFQLSADSLLKNFEHKTEADKALAVHCLASISYNYRDDWVNAIKYFLTTHPSIDAAKMVKFLVPNAASSLKIEDTKIFLACFKNLITDLRIDDDNARLRILENILPNTAELASRMQNITQECISLFETIGILKNVDLKTTLVISLYKSKLSPGRLGLFIEQAKELCTLTNSKNEVAVKKITDILENHQGREFTHLTDSIKLLTHYTQKSVMF